MIEIRTKATAICTKSNAGCFGIGISERESRKKNECDMKIVNKGVILATTLQSRFQASKHR